MSHASKTVSEKVLWGWLKAGEPEGRQLHMRRIENLVGVGDPDVSGCYLSRYFDLELKTADRPAKGSTPILNSVRRYVRPEQKVWHRCRWLAGGSNFVLLQVGGGSGALRYLLPGLLIRDIEDKSELALASLSVIHPRASALEFIERAASYRSTLA